MNAIIKIHNLIRQVINLIMQILDAKWEAKFYTFCKFFQMDKFSIIMFIILWATLLCTSFVSVDSSSIKIFPQEIFSKTRRVQVIAKNIILFDSLNVNPVRLILNPFLCSWSEQKKFQSNYEGIREIFIPFLGHLILFI